MKAPPYLPEETLFRVLRLARFDGLSVLGVAGFFALLAAGSHDVLGALGGVAVAGGGAIELSGTGRLLRGDARAMRWLIAGQLCIMGSIFLYVLLRQYHPDPMLVQAFKTALASNEEQRLVLRENGFTEAQFIQFGCAAVYFSFALVTLFYQGGMIVYYLRRQGAVQRAVVDSLEVDTQTPEA
jgi:hypothetical protein